MATYRNLLDFRNEIRTDIAIRDDGIGIPLDPSSKQIDAVEFRKWLAAGNKIGEALPFQQRTPVQRLNDLGLTVADLRAILAGP